MNNIYKVIWSKAKNCYVVASEIARSHTKSASGSEKIGGGTRRKLLASLMALSLLCGGLGVAEATVQVNADTGGAYEVYTTGETYSKETVDAKLGSKANAKDVATNTANIANLEKNKLSKADASETYATKGELDDLKTVVNGKANAAALGEYAKTADVVTKVNEEKNARELNDDKLSGRIDTLSTTVDSKVSKTDLNTTLRNYYTQAETNAAIKTAVDDEKNARENAINGEVTERNKAIDDAIAREETNRDVAITKAKTDLQEKVKAEETARKEEDAKLERKITENTTAINNEKTAREAAVTDLSKRIGTVDEDGKYIKKSATNNVSENLKVLDNRAKVNADAIEQETTERKAAIGELAADGNYIERANNVSDNLVELDKQAKTNADAITETNQRTHGITRNDIRKETSIEGRVTVDTDGNIKAEGTITGKGVDAGDGEIKTTGKVSAGDVSTGTLETTGKATIGGALEVKGNLNVGKIEMSHVENDTAAGKSYNNSTTIDADGIISSKEVTDRDGSKVESNFTNNANGTSHWVKKTESDGSWTKASSDVTLDETTGQTTIKNTVEDSENNKNESVDTVTDSKRTLTDTDGNTNEWSQNAKETSNVIKDKDGKEKASTKMDADGNITNTGTNSVTNKVGENEVKVSTSGVDIKADENGTIKESVGDNVNREMDKDHIKDSIGTSTSREITDGKITDTAGDATVTTEKGKGTTFGKDGSTGTTNIYGDTITTGTVDADTIKANETTTGKLTAGVGENENGARLTVNDDGVKGSYKSGDYTSKSYILKNTLKSGVDNGTGTDDNYTIGSRTDHSITDDGQAKLDETVKDANGSNVTNKTSTSTTTTIKDVTTGNTTSSEMTSTTITNKAADTIIDKAGDYTVTTDKDNGTTFGKEGSAKTTNIKEDTVTTGTLKANDTITGTLTAGVGETEEGSRLTVDDNGVKGSVKSDKYTSKSYILKDTLQSGVDNGKDITDNGFVGSRTDHYMDGDKAKLNETVKDADGSNVTKKTSTKTYTEIKDTNGNTLSVNQKADGNNYKLEDQDGNGNTNHVTNSATQSKQTLKDKDGNTLTTNQTATKNNFDLKSADGSKENHTTNTVDESRVAIKGENGKAELSTTDEGTTFKHSAAKEAFTEGGATNTTIKGNTITTGKVTMDYADVMKDLGVYGNTTLGEAGKDTTLTVNSKATFNEIATFENGAEVNNGLTVSSGGLNVTGESTFNDKVTMKNGLDVTGGVASDSFTVKGTDIKIDSSGINAGGTVISNVADGSISEGSKDAVNGGQLYQVKNDLEGKVNKVGANAAAMANLHPMEFDPDSKWNIAAAMGNYGSETATAIGAFYRPNEDVMVNFSTAFGTGENMVGGGVSVRLGKGSNKLSREESNALKDQVDDLTARMDALLSVLNPNMSKDFPDVPENHWAYEAVSRLAGNDIVQGYPDGEFHGERTMTRYEMAEIIYNALSRGAEAERELVEEFKPELQAMAASEKATAERAEG